MLCVEIVMRQHSAQKVFSVYMQHPCLLTIVSNSNSNTATQQHSNIHRNRNNGHEMTINKLYKKT